MTIKFLSQLFRPAQPSIAESQRRRLEATESRIRSEGAPLAWDADRFRRQYHTSADVGKVIQRPFSRLDTIEQRIREGGKR